MVSGSRIYDINGEKLPSVTTILKATESKEKKESLQLWRSRIGDTAADEIIKKSSTRGTKMHKHIEEYLIGQSKMDLGFDDSHIMSQKIINKALKIKLTEVWGSEINLYYPKKYAGTADAVGIYDGIQSILDFKQSNKTKRKEWIIDYFYQVAAYSLAHNYIYKTDITQCVILICTPPPLLEFQEFVIKDDELVNYQHLFIDRVSQYNKLINDVL
tara:strand:+ start:128 stop:772 length:645 start_codon:yes stop_codon:yes gene_type:complete